MIASCKNKTEKENKEIIKPVLPIVSSVTLKTSIDSQILSKENVSLYVKATLTNNASSELAYQTMSCAWDSYFRNDSRDFDILYNICFLNNIYIDTIPPFQSREFHFALKSRKPREQINNQPFRIGYFLVRDSESSRFDIYDNTLVDSTHMIWSSPIKMN